MKLKSLIVIILAFLAMLPAQGIRHTGTGGGEAELFVLEMFPVIPAWLKACAENPLVCGVSSSTIQELRALKPLVNVDFKNQADGLYPCQGETLILNHESLYESNNVIPKEDQFLAAEMFKGWAQCRGSSDIVSPQQLKVLPWAKHSLAKELYVLVGETTDVAVDMQSDLNLHQELQTQMKCSSYQALQLSEDQMQLLCKDNGDQYVAYLSRQNGKLKVKVKYQSSSDDGL